MSRRFRRMRTRLLFLTSITFALSLALGGGSALAQQTTTTGPTATTPPPTAEEPLITGDTLFVLMLVVVVLGMFLLGLIVWHISKDAQPAEKGFAYRPLIEGMVLVMVIVALIILGITGKITAEGLASVLAAIVGYAVGRAAGGQTETGAPGTTEPRASVVAPPPQGVTPQGGSGTPVAAVTPGGVTAAGAVPLIQPTNVQSPDFVEFSQKQLDRLADPTALFDAVKEEGEITARDPFPPAEESP